MRVARDFKGDSISANDVTKLPVLETTISFPTKGNIVYNTDTDSLYYADGSAWAPIGGGGGGVVVEPINIDQLYDTTSPGVVVTGNSVVNNSLSNLSFTGVRVGDVITGCFSFDVAVAPSVNPSPYDFSIVWQAGANAPTILPPLLFSRTIPVALTSAVFNQSVPSLPGVVTMGLDGSVTVTGIFVQGGTYRCVVPVQVIVSTNTGGAK